MEPLTFAAQLNAIKTLTQMAHASAISGDRLEAVKLLNRAQGMIAQAVATPVVPMKRKDTQKSATTTINYNTMFDEIAVAQIGRKYNRATDAQRTVIQDLARRVMEGREREVA